MFTLGAAGYEQQRAFVPSALPMAVLQGPITSAFPGLIPALIDEISTCFRRLFYEGVQVKGRTWNAACIGHKGDLKWYTIQFGLTRSYEHQGRTRHLACCHLCMGGVQGVEWEDCAEQPQWGPTIYQERPWNAPAHYLTTPGVRRWAAGLLFPSFSLMSQKLKRR